MARLYRESMRKSRCKHCLPTYFPGKRDENKGRIGYSCELEEWDDMTVCRKGYCRYYSAEGGAE